MKLQWMALLSLLAFGCASTNAPPGGDGGGGHAICPDHPEQCGGKCCGSKCIDITLDPLNCGDCGIACDTGQLCRSGSCGCLPSGTVCGTGQSCCGNTGCKSLMSDAFNCGTCGHVCGSGGTCMNGSCTCGGQTCGTGQTCCGGMCQSTCVTDMGVAQDLSMSSGGACQCTNHCATDPIGWCVGTNCCYVDAIAGSCMIGPCSINMTP
jgi:hypothetical protein